MERSLIPVACTLAPVELRGRVDRWRELRVRSWAVDGGRLEVEVDPADAALLAELAAAERTCCGWAAWEVEGARLAVTGPADAVAAVAEVLVA